MATMIQGMRGRNLDYFVITRYSYPWEVVVFQVVGNTTGKVGFLFIFRVIPPANESSQANGPIGAAAAGIYHSHSNVGSEPLVQPMLQLVVTTDP